MPPVENASPPAVRPIFLAIAADFDRHALVNGLLAWLFATTAALAVLLAAAQQGNLDHAAVASWIFGGYAFSGALTLGLALYYRQPLGMGWSIPAAALVGPAFGHYAFSDIIGAYLATGLLLTVLGLTGGVSRLMKAIPAPVMMGMVAGVFLPFGVRILHGFVQTPGPTTAMVIAYAAMPLIPRIGKRMPPVLGALVAGIVVAIADHSIQPLVIDAAWARPTLFAPTLSWPAMIELVLPLAITVIGIQNPPGFAVLRQTGHAPPIDAVTTACGIVSMACAVVGCGPACMTGPANAIIVSSGTTQRHYVGALVFGSAMLAFGVFAPAAVALASALPADFIAVLGGLALLPVLRGTFAAAFGAGRFTFGAIVAFMTATGNFTLLHIGAGFWALVFGVAASLALDRDDFRR